MHGLKKWWSQSTYIILGQKLMFINCRRTQAHWVLHGILYVITTVVVLNVSGILIQVLHLLKLQAYEISAFRSLRFFTYTAGVIIITYLTAEEVLPCLMAACNQGLCSKRIPFVEKVVVLNLNIWWVIAFAEQLRYSSILIALSICVL